MSVEPVDGYEFGPFAVNTRTQLLLRNGSRLRIERLPLLVLLTLLEEPGSVITREEICARLWSGQAFQQADKGLQVAVAKLREALGEQAAEPRFIKTVHRVGYQFIGQVVSSIEAAPDLNLSDRDMPTEAGDSAQAGHRNLGAAAEEPVGKNAFSPSRAALFGRVRASKSFFLVAPGVTALAVAAGLFFYHSNRPLASAGEQIALGNISNLTNDQGLEGTLTTAMRVKFQESPYLGIVPDQTFLQQMKSAGGSNTLRSRLSACASLHAHLLADGEIKVVSPDARSPSYEIVLNVWRCGDSRRLGSESASAASKSLVLSALDSVVDRLRKRLGESEASIEKFNAPAAQITTNSLAALKAFNLGDDKRNDGLQTEAIADFRLAIDLDPEFALAYARLGTVYYNTHERSLSQQYSRRAFELREHTSERERLYIASHYYSFVTGEVPEAMQAYDLWMSLYPHDPAPAANLANEYLSIGDPGKALELARRAAEDERVVNGGANSVLMLSLLESGQYSSLNAICQNTAQSSSQSAVFHFTCLRLAGINNDVPRIEAEIAWARDTPGSVGVIEFAALLADDKGRLSGGQSLFSEGRESARSGLLTNFAAELDLDQADIDAGLGLFSQARDHALEALKLAPGEPYIEGLAAFALARAGDNAEAKTEADKAAAEAPLDTILNGAVLPSAYAAIEMSRHNAKAAIALMEKTRPLDGNMFMELSPAYYRGVAMLEVEQIDAARREFRWVIDHGMLCPESIYVNLAKFRLGRMQQMSGRCNDAMKYYGELEVVWRNADPAFQPLKEVQSAKKACSVGGVGDETVAR